MSSWSREAIEALGPVTEVPVVAEVLGVGEWTVYEAIRRGTWELTRVLRIGRRIKIPTHDLVELLYGTGPVGAGPAPLSLSLRPPTP